MPAVTTTPSPARTSRDAVALRLVAAPTWRRATAALVDAIPLVTLWLLLAMAIAASGAAEGPAASPWNPLDQLADFINARPVASATIAAAFFGLLFAVPWISGIAWGRTPGERLLDLVAVDQHGRRPGPARVTAHCVLRVVGVAALCVGPLWALADPERRTLHDRLAGIWLSHVRHDGDPQHAPSPRLSPQEPR